MIRGTICLACLSLALTAHPPARFRPEIPRVWQEAALSQLEVPVSHPEYSAKAVTEDYYYRIPVLPIYKSYPVYAPGRMPGVHGASEAPEARARLYPSRFQTNQAASLAATDPPTGAASNPFAGHSCPTAPGWCKPTPSRSSPLSSPASRTVVTSLSRRREQPGRPWR